LHRAKRAPRKWRRKWWPRNVRVGDELGLGVAVPRLLNLDDALEGHPLVGDAADDDGFLGRGGCGAGGALARGGRGLRGAARRIGSGAGEREAAAREAGVAGAERVGVGGGCGGLGRQPASGEGAVRGLAHEQHRGGGGGDGGGEGVGFTFGWSKFCFPAV
jgi:hypothetical protein